MRNHSIAPFLDRLEGFKRNPKSPAPLPPELLQKIPFIPAPEPIDAPVPSRAMQTFRVDPKHRQTPRIVRSSLADGAWEIEGSIVDWGLSGREIIDIGVAKSKGRHKRNPKDLEAFIPISAPIVVNPQAGLANRRHLIRSTDGRRYQLDQNKTFIYQFDDRNFLYPAAYPWWCICKLNFWTRMSEFGPWDFAGSGTGVLAGRNVCLTASHVFPKNTFAGWKCDVIAGSWGGPSMLGARGFTNVHSVLRGPSKEPGSDIMVMGLFDPLGATAGYFGTKTYTDDWEDNNWWTLAGYPWDFAPFPSTQGWIAVYDDDYGPNVTLPNGDWWDSLQLESYADSASGLSGGPLFGWFDNGWPYVIGVHKGREAIDYGLGTDANSVASGGRLLDAMVGWARGQWD